jgi:hypothetical protein
MENTNCLVPVFDQIAATLRAGHRVWVVGEMDLPAPGAAAPPVLPPPPLPGYGYSGVPYLVSWPARVAYFLSEHSAHFDSEQLPVAVIPGFQEDFQLFSAEGWRK